MDIGRNRTGIAVSPIDSQKMQDGDQATPSNGGTQALMDVRIEYSQHAEPVGTMPPPGTIKGAVGTATSAMKGEKLAVFLDALGERLAFERTGTRLYEALLAKFAASHHTEGGPTREEIEDIRDEELSHFQLLAQTMTDLGADPTSVTPSADISGVASSGVLAVLTDPRTTLTEALKAVLMLELTDNDSWMSLVEIADALGEDELAAEFEDALADEREHLSKVRGWLASALSAQLGAALGGPESRPDPSHV